MIIIILFFNPLKKQQEIGDELRNCLCTLELSQSTCINFENIWGQCGKAIAINILSFPKAINCKVIVNKSLHSTAVHPLNVFLNISDENDILAWMLPLKTH